MLRNISSCLFPHISTITSPNHYLSEWDDWEKQGLPEEQRTEAVRRLHFILFISTYQHNYIPQPLFVRMG
ncbi:leucine-rich repeat domain-containing protein [Shigella flexneri]|uniref:leucine-rich repeat domain-containing protein n=1 Tax=Shigella flexneri TaxID=623 RepID=UPI00343035FC